MRPRPDTAPINALDDDLSLYDLYLKHHRKITIAYTWVFVIVYAMVVILSAIVFSGAIWSPFEKSQEEVYVNMGYAFTMVFFIGLGFSLAISVASKLYWAKNMVCTASRYATLSG